MAAAFPHHYEVTLQLEDAEHAEGTLATDNGPPVLIGPPPQFDGRAGHHNPEGLLLGAIASCHLTTFLSLTRRKGMSVRGYRAVASGTLEKTRDGLHFTSFHLRVEIATDAGHQSEIERLAEMAHDYCIVTGALRLEVTLETLVTVQP